MNQDKLKIVFLYKENDPYTKERIKYFINNGHSVYSIVFSLDAKEIFDKKNKIIKLKKNNISKIPLIKRVIHYFEIKKILYDLKPDVFHVVSALNLFYLQYKVNLIKIIENQGSDVILTISNSKFLKYFSKIFYKNVDGIVQDSEQTFLKGVECGAVSNSDINKIIEIGIDFNIFNEHVPNGVIRSKYNLASRPIIFHSRGISKLYNISTILESINIVKKTFHDVIFIFTTHIEKLNTEQKKIIKNNKLERNILFVGYQNRINDLKYFYRDANINISVPSSDSSPFSVYESMACFTANIVTDLPWLYNRFIPGKHLITCPVKDAQILAECIVNFLQGNIKVDLKAAYNVVFNEINLLKENEKLEKFYYNLLFNTKIIV